MDALVPALIAAALAELGDKTPWLVALLAVRYGRAGIVIAGACLGVVLASAISAAMGALVQPLLTVHARLLFLALALLMTGAGAMLRVKAPDPLDGWRLGAFATSAIGVFILQFGEGTQFLVAALAVNAKLPALAALGATLGICAVIVPAALAGPALIERVPFRAIRIGVGVLFLLIGLWSAAGALRLL